MDRVDVSVPGVVAADLLVVQVGLVFGELDACSSTHQRDPATRTSSARGDWCAAVADVVGQFGGLADRAAYPAGDAHWRRGR